MVARVHCYDRCTRTGMVAVLPGGCLRSSAAAAQVNRLCRSLRVCITTEAVSRCVHGRFRVRVRVRGRCQPSAGLRTRFQHAEAVRKLAPLDQQLLVLAPHGGQSPQLHHLVYQRDHTRQQNQELNLERRTAGVVIDDAVITLPELRAKPVDDARHEDRVDHAEWHVLPASQPVGMRSSDYRPWA